MNIINDGGPAFPQPCTSNGYAANSPYNFAGGGMSIREYFVGQALAGMSLINITKDGHTVIADSNEVTNKCIEISDLLIQKLYNGEPQR